MIIGTSHFVDRESALNYYSYQGGMAGIGQIVDQKLEEGEIHLGPPEVKKGERLFVNDEGRYCIESKEKR